MVGCWHAIKNVNCLLLRFWYSGMLRNDTQKSAMKVTFAAQKIAEILHFNTY